MRLLDALDSTTKEKLDSLGNELNSQLTRIQGSEASILGLGNCTSMIEYQLSELSQRLLTLESNVVKTSDAGKTDTALWTNASGLIISIREGEETPSGAIPLTDPGRGRSARLGPAYALKEGRSRRQANSADPIATRAECQQRQWTLQKRARSHSRDGSKESLRDVIWDAKLLAKDLRLLEREPGWIPLSEVADLTRSSENCESQRSKAHHDLPIGSYLLAQKEACEENEDSNKFGPIKEPKLARDLLNSPSRP